jgi:hypothetical protein
MRVSISNAKQATPGVRKGSVQEAGGANEVGCRILRNFLKNFRTRLNAAPTGMADYF